MRMRETIALAGVLDTFSASAIAPSENTQTDIWIVGWLDY